MRQDDPVERVGLAVRSSDEATRLTILDGQLHAVAHSIGSLNREFSPGIYKVVAQTGDVSDSRLIRLTDEAQKVDFAPLKYHSSAPLAGTSRPMGPDVDAAIKKLLASTRRQKPPCRLILVIRGSPQIGAIAADAASRTFGAGLSLHDVLGKEMVVNFEADDPNQQRGKDWWAKVADLNPGHHRIRLEIEKDRLIEGSLFATPGWITTIFLDRSSFGSSTPGRRIPRADLAGASIFCTRRDAVDVHSSEARLTDLARLGLAQRRQVLSDVAVRKIFGGEFTDPMLGIIAGYLSLLENPVPGDVMSGSSLLKRLFGDAKEPLSPLVSILREQFAGLPHPDVEALGLALGGAKPAPAPFPPMLLASWWSLIDGSARFPDLVPAGSVSERIAVRCLPRGPWLRGEYVPENEAEWTRKLLASCRPALENALPRLEGGTIPERLRKPGSPPRDFPGSFGGLDWQRFPSSYLQEILKESDRRSIVSKLGLPLSTVERLIAGIIQQPDPLVQIAARPTVLPEGVLGNEQTIIRIGEGGEVRVTPGKPFGVEFRSRRAGKGTVVVCGPEGVFIFPKEGEVDYDVAEFELAKYDSLQAPNANRAMLLVIVTERRLDQALRGIPPKELGALTDNTSDMTNRLTAAVKEAGQEWAVIGFATLVPDPNLKPAKSQ